MKTLYLPLKKKWYEMIERGEKHEEYRKITNYWLSRMFFAINLNGTRYEIIGAETIKWYAGRLDRISQDLQPRALVAKFDTIRFSCGYTKRTMTFSCKGVYVGFGSPQWGAPSDRRVYGIRLGEWLD